MIFLLLFACRPELGDPVYPNWEQISTQETEDGAEGDGPDPYLDGEKRLSLGIFYEGGYSDIVEIDAGRASFYIWSNTFEVVPSADKVEGSQSDILRGGTNVDWLGGGILWEPAGDMQEWTHLYVSLKSMSADAENLTLGMEDASGVAVNVLASSYGFSADGDWYNLRVPLEELTAAVETDGTVFDRSQVNYVLTHICESLSEPVDIHIDNLYLTQEE